MNAAQVTSEVQVTRPQRGDVLLDAENNGWSVHEVRTLGTSSIGENFVVRIGRVEAGARAATMALSSIEFFKLASMGSLRLAAR